MSGSKKVSTCTLGPASDAGQERDFDVADSMEKGLAHELVTDFMYSLPQASWLWKFHVDRSHDRKQYRLFSENGEFLLYAKVSSKNLSVNLFTYDPKDKDCLLFDPNKPAFTMKFKALTNEWQLIQERCDKCCYSPEHLLCSCGGRREVASIRHTQQNVGDGISHCMDVYIISGDSMHCQDTWVESSQKRQLGVHRLMTKLPIWNADLQSLVLDFKGRKVIPSSKNFQLATRDDPNHIVCQYAKLAHQKFSLDFRYPITAIQAFGISLTSPFWEC